ncbi:hypothetical protein ES708_18586 [subsurface metagenome]
MKMQKTGDINRAWSNPDRGNLLHRVQCMHWEISEGPF